jgi:type II secretory pathway pseudopilin PulG
MELIVSVAIFAFMTAFVVAKYGNFNQGILLTSLAYDVALTIHNAQSYGLNVKSAPGSSQNFSTEFKYAYGVHFSKNSSNNTKMIFFADGPLLAPDGIYDLSGGDSIISTYTLKGGSKVSDLCIKTAKNSNGSLSSCDSVDDTLDITFKRPDPDAIITGNEIKVNRSNVYAEILLQSSNGSTIKVIVQNSGQVEVSN